MIDASLQLDDEGYWSFDAARGGDPEDYGEFVVRRADQIGALFAACEDIADAFGSRDYDETEPALLATLHQWRHVADALQPTDRLATRLRATAIALERELEEDDFDSDYVTDLISIAKTRDDLLDLAATLEMHRDGGGDVESWWEEHVTEVLSALAIRTGLLEDVAARGEDLPVDWRP